MRESEERNRARHAQRVQHSVPYVCKYHTVRTTVLNYELVTDIFRTPPIGIARRVFFHNFPARLLRGVRASSKYGAR